jgi:dihydrofolate reductase
MSVNAILACDLNYAIGYQGDLPWPKNKKDLEWFRDNTLGHVVLMGRTTWESIGGKNLSGRPNVVVTTKNIVGPDHIESGDAQSILDSVQEKYPFRDIWVIGGANIYLQFFPLCDKLYLTTIQLTCECDTFVSKKMIDSFPNTEFSQAEDGLIFEIRNR